MKEEFTFFWGGICYSQWHPCTFTVDKTEYNCTEQYMMAEKARLFNDVDAEQAIMEETSPSKQKKLGRNVIGFEKEEWDAVARDIVYRGNYAKFTQNEDFKDEILSTEGTTLVEASPYDRVWGIGLSDGEPKCYVRDKWRGKNWLGEVLTQVRDDIISDVERTTSNDFQWISDLQE